MADLTAITVTDLTANGTKAITVGVNTQATGSQTFAMDVGGQSDRVILNITSTGTNQIDVTVSAGTNPPAFRQGLGALTKTGLTNGSISWLGPFETARFVGTDGKMSVIVAPTTATNALAAFSAYAVKLPIV